MSLSQPLILSLTNGEESIFVSWSAVIDATEYEIEIKAKKTGRKQTYNTTKTNVLIKDLENGQAYEVKVTAMNESERSEPSIDYMVRPKLRPSLSTVKVKLGETAGTIHIRWTATATDFGFNIERCDICPSTGYKRIAWLPYNDVITYEDQTNCPSLEHGCSGHYYTVRYRDSAWWHGAGVLSQKVFCMSVEDAYCHEEIQTHDMPDENTDESSVEEPVVIAGMPCVIESTISTMTESALSSSEKCDVEEVKQDESSVHLEPTMETLTTDHISAPTSADSSEVIILSDENSSSQ